MSTKSIDRDDSKRLMVFAGTSSKALGAQIGSRLGIELGEVIIQRFQDGEIYVRFEESIRGADIFLVREAWAGGRLLRTQAQQKRRSCWRDVRGMWEV